MVNLSAAELRALSMFSRGIPLSRGGHRMSSGSHQQYLSPSDIEMIERVLQAGLRKPSASPALSCEAAKLLIRKFQEGVTDEADLTLVLDRHFWVVSNATPR
ncbi:hypothetical protein M2281_005145 [Mesorhizobium soli]|uniref:hypothetical protein n=1 Tax=Pseudaminobacter soli (ex Li et al. 2025) TaxID=1295366 RepID=UPI0024760E24|nr:hypothetical protein [Mesorhizobium soli]MDH6234527.1 hypothetical protein [Mesorhizobium soli]